MDLPHPALQHLTGPREGATTEHERLLAVYRGWQKARRNPMQFSWRKSDGSGLAFFGLAGLLLILVVPIDAALWGSREDLWAFPLPVTGRALLWTLALASLINGFFIHRLLSRKTVADLSTPWHLLVARCLFACVPLAGWAVFPVWHWLLQHRPAWISSSSKAQPELRLRQNRARSSRGWLLEKLDESIHLVITINSCVLLLLVSHWIQGLVPSSPDFRWWPGLLFSITLHLFIFSGMAWHLKGEVASARTLRLRSLGLLTLTALLLLPIPILSFFVFVLLLLLSPTHPAEDTLVHALFRQRGTSCQLPIWWDLREKIQQNRQMYSWGQRLRIAPRETLPARIQVSEATQRVRVLLRRKTLSLVPDAIALSLAVPLLASYSPWISLLLAAGLAVAGLLSLPLLATGIGILGFRAVHRRRNAAGPPIGLLDQHFFGIYLTRTAGLFFLGLVSGHLWRNGQTELLGSIFGAAGVVGLMMISGKAGSQVLRQLLDVEGFRFSDWSPILGMLRQALSILGLMTASGIVLALAKLGLGKLFVAIWLPCSLLWGARLTQKYLPWLLRTSPGQPSSGLSPGMAAFIRATAILPLGGLAVPLWLLACRRLKNARPDRAQELARDLLHSSSMGA